MVTVVLPTKAIVQELAPYSYLLDFYEGGLKGLVRDSFAYAMPWASQIERDTLTTELYYKVWIDYICHNEKNQLKRTEQQDTALLNRMRPVFDRSHSYANAVMGSIFPKQYFEINTKWHDWVGDDLIINVDSWHA